MTGLILRFCAAAFAVALASYLLEGVHVEDPWSALKAALVLGILNAIIKPILLILTFPATVLTLGLFIFVINGFLFWLTGYFLDGFEVTGFWTSIAGALIVSVVSIIADRFAKARPNA